VARPALTRGIGISFMRPTLRSCCRRSEIRPDSRLEVVTDPILAKKRRARPAAAGDTKTSRLLTGKWGRMLSGREGSLDRNQAVGASRIGAAISRDRSSVRIALLRLRF